MSIFKQSILLRVAWTTELQIGQRVRDAFTLALLCTINNLHKHSLHFIKEVAFEPSRRWRYQFTLDNSLRLPG